MLNFFNPVDYSQIFIRKHHRHCWRATFILKEYLKLVFQYTHYICVCVCVCAHKRTCAERAKWRKHFQNKITQSWMEGRLQNLEEEKKNIIQQSQYLERNGCFSVTTYLID